VGVIGPQNCLSVSSPSRGWTTPSSRRSPPDSRRLPSGSYHPEEPETMDTQIAPHVSLGKAVLQIREKKKMSKKSVAALGGFTPRWLADLESGKTNPTWDNFRRVAVAMKVSLPQLMKVVESIERQDRGESACH
jgi:ribosome-binding protein aMBF1 (putative translation factor)